MAEVRSIQGRVPPHALDAEAAVISACVLKPDALEAVLPILQEKDFFATQHRVIFSTILELHTEGTAIDIVTLGHALAKRGKLGQIGGAHTLGTLVDATPAVANVTAHAEIVVSMARRRAVIQAAHEIVAEGYGDSPDYELGAATRIADAANLGHSKTNVLAAWQTVELGLLCSPPPAQPWLLRHPTRDGGECAPGHGDGLLPLGKAGLLSSEGGTGKTMALIQLAVSVITGRPWLGHFDVAYEARGRKVCLALAEETMADVHRRLYPLAESLQLTQRERELVVERLVVLPLAGKPVALLSYAQDRTIHETPELFALRAKLQRREHAEDTGFALVVLDPLARWAGPDVEADNAAATRFVQAVESLGEVFGRPTVLVAHHSSKLARRTGTADARGVTAITDGFRWAGTLRSHQGEVRFQQAKSNYSVPMHEELVLRRRRSGVLSVPSLDEERREEAMREQRVEDRDAAKTAVNERAVAELGVKLLVALRRSKVELHTRAQVCALVPGRKAILETALTRLLAAGEIQRTAAGFVATESQHGGSECS